MNLLLLPKTAYEFKYEGDFEGIDAMVTLQTQIFYITALREICHNVDPDSVIDIKIAGTEKGSIVIRHLIEMASVGGIFLSEHHTTIATAFKILGDIVKLVKYFRNFNSGKLDKKDIQSQQKDGMVVINVVGNNNSLAIGSEAFRLYQNSVVLTSSLNKTGALLEQSEEIKGINVTDHLNNELLRLGREDIVALTEPNPYLAEKKGDEQIYLNQVLYIKKPNLYPDKKQARNKKWIWEFIFKGRTIKANITADGFRDQINQGLHLAQGYRLKADIKIYLDFDSTLQTFIERPVYEVFKVNGIIERDSEQSSVQTE